MMKFLDDEGREGTGVGRKRQGRRPSRTRCPTHRCQSNPYGRGDWDGRLEPSVGDHGLFHCGCGWKSSVPDIGEWRRHMADAILAELAEVRERG